MTEKELRKLNRKQLLELLLVQTERADRLEAELDRTGKRLRNKLLSQKEAGSIAEAALKLNGIFQAADAAAAQYLENIRIISEYQDKLTEDIEAEAREKAEAIISDAKKQADSIRQSANAMLADTQSLCAAQSEESEKLLKASRLLYEYLSAQKLIVDSLIGKNGGGNA